MQSVAQKKARENFKKAIAYRTKKGCSLKEAFAKVKGNGSFSPLKNKVGPKKAAKKKIGALPIGFKGSIWGVNFKIVNQFDIYNEVNSIMEDSETGSTIVVFDGKGNANNFGSAILSYVLKNGDNKYKTLKDKNILKSNLIKFSTSMQKEVQEYNKGKKKTIKILPLKINAPKNITKKPIVKKQVVKKSASKKITTGKKLRYSGTLPSQDGKKSYRYTLGNLNSNKNLIDQRNQLEKLINQRNILLSLNMDIYKTPNLRSDLKIQSKKIIRVIKEQQKTLKLHLKEINQLISKSQ